MDYQDIESISDERFEYVLRLCYKIDVVIDENDGGWLGGWIIHFYNRLQHGKIKPPFTWEAFCDNEDIIATLEGYGLDVEKFWLVLLFIYDLTMDKTLNLADFRKSQYEVLTDIQSYLANHPNARLYLSDDKDIPKNNRCEITSPMVLRALRRFVQENLTLLEEHPEQKEFRSVSYENGFDTQLSASYQQIFMYKQLDTLFNVLQLPEKRAKRGEPVSYSKLLLISRLIYFCRLTRNEAFAVDSSSLKGIIKEYGDYTFPLTSKVYF